MAEPAGAYLTSFGRYQLSEDGGSAGVEVLVGPSGARSTLRFDEHGLVLRQCANGTWELSQYDDEGRLEGRLVWKSAQDGALQSWSVRYEWSAEGDLVRVVDSLRGTSVYRTDAAHRLIGESTPDGQELIYELDLADNVLSKPKAGRQGVSRLEVGSGNQLVASDTETFGYDQRDHLSVRRDRRTGTTTRYVYDSFDLLVRIETRGPDGAELEPAWEYAYDALGRRTEVRRGQYRRQFYWDGDRLGAEVMPNGALRVYEYAGHGALVPLGFTDYASADAPPESGKHYTVFTDPVGQPVRRRRSLGGIATGRISVPASPRRAARARRRGGSSARARGAITRRGGSSGSRSASGPWRVPSRRRSPRSRGPRARARR